MKRNICAMAVIIMLCTLVTAGSAVAYFSHATEKVENVITTGIARIKLHEESEWGEERTLNPGETLSKTPTVENTGSVEVFVRIRMTLDSTTATMLRKKTLVFEGVNHEYWDVIPKDFTLLNHSDGLEVVATLRGSLAAGETSPHLFTGVTLGNKYVEGNPDPINIVLVAEAVQTIDSKSASECFAILSSPQQ